MQILSVDIGTGTQDVYLFRSGLSIENGFKLVMPSPTMRVRAQIQEATRRGDELLLTGVTMGGGPSHWAAEAHLAAGLKLYATPEAAQTFNDDLDWVEREMGIVVMDEHEASNRPAATHLQLRDFDYDSIVTAFAAFGVSLAPDAVAIAVFDHGQAPTDVSDRQFRFDYLRDRIASENRLSAFAYPIDRLPASMTRLRAVAHSASALACPVLVMDTAPAAVMGARYDPLVAERSRVMVVNIGNFHALAFRLGTDGIEGVFEHHTGELDRTRLEFFLEKFAQGRLQHEEVFEDQGHGALLFSAEPLPLNAGDYGVAVTGPRRALMAGSRLRPYFAVPHGDMMLAGCFGLLGAVADHLPELAAPIHAALTGSHTERAPWDPGS